MLAAEDRGEDVHVERDGSQYTRENAPVEIDCARKGLNSVRTLRGSSPFTLRLDHSCFQAPS